MAQNYCVYQSDAPGTSLVAFAPAKGGSGDTPPHADITLKMTNKGKKNYNS